MMPITYYVLLQPTSDDSLISKSVSGLKCKCMFKEKHDV